MIPPTKTYNLLSPSLLSVNFKCQKLCKNVEKSKGHVNNNNWFLKLIN